MPAEPSVTPDQTPQSVAAMTRPSSSPYSDSAPAKKLSTPSPKVINPGTSMLTAAPPNAGKGSTRKTRLPARAAATAAATPAGPPPAMKTSGSFQTGICLL